MVLKLFLMVIIHVSGANNACTPGETDRKSSTAVGPFDHFHRTYQERKLQILESRFRQVCARDRKVSFADC